LYEYVKEGRKFGEAEICDDHVFGYLVPGTGIRQAKANAAAVPSLARCEIQIKDRGPRHSLFPTTPQPDEYPSKLYDTAQVTTSTPASSSIEPSLAFTAVSPLRPVHH
jgi:hypothetical protein